jgi:ABC-type branched-subunit amino acid transport system permease subunit
MFAAASGLLLAPMVGLDAIILTLLVVQAFGAAAIGAFSSLPLTFGGGVLVGVGASLATKYVSRSAALGGLPPSLPFVVFFVVLLVLPKHRLVEASTRRRRPPERAERSVPAGAKLVGSVVILVLLIAVPSLVGARLPLYANGLIFVIVFASLGLLVWTSGQVSLCHASFAAVGAAAFSHLAHGIHLPWGLALVGAGLVAVPVGALVAIPAIRLSGLYLALATFGFGILLQRIVFSTGAMFGENGTRLAPRPAGFAGDKAFYYLVLGVVVATIAAVAVIHRSRLGRLLRALADSPLALSVHGTNVQVTRVLVFCISAFFAAVAGALLASASGSISGVGFGPTQSLMWLTTLAIAGNSLVRSPVLAALGLGVLPAYLSNVVVDYQPAIFGVLAISVAVTADGSVQPDRWLRSLAERSRPRGRNSPVAARTAAARLAIAPATGDPT